MSPRKSLTVCSVPSCPALCSGGRCDDHKREAERLRGSASSRGYGHRHRTVFRDGVLTRDPVCTEPGCVKPSTDADHYPLDRKELVRRGLDPDDPKHGRGLCGPHHAKSTAERQPGGWAAK